MKTLTTFGLCEYWQLGRTNTSLLTDGGNPGQITKNQKQTMAWMRRGYLQLVIKLKAQIGMCSYPTMYIIPPKMANKNKEHAAQVVKGWQAGAIKWVVLSEDEIEDQEKEPENLPKPLKQHSGVDDNGNTNEEGQV